MLTDCCGAGKVNDTNIKAGTTGHKYFLVRMSTAVHVVRDPKISRKNSAQATLSMRHLGVLKCFSTVSGCSSSFSSLCLNYRAQRHPKGRDKNCRNLSGRHRGLASLVFSHRGGASQRISAARTRIARILASHRIAISMFTLKAKLGKNGPKTQIGLIR